jgi:D-alanine transaminase
MSNYPSKVYINGDIVDALNAKISIFDRGFLYGDGIYEVIVQINGKLFFKNEHLNRLDYCLKQINIDFNIDYLEKELDNLLEVNNLKTGDCLIYIQITRGIAPRKHSYPKDAKPSLIMYAIPYLIPETNNQLVSVNSIIDYRWNRCDLKTTSLLGNVMANEMAILQGNYETIFIRNHKITEASHSNIFFVKNKTVFTHPANTSILNGITRIIVIKLCEQFNIQLKEQAIDYDDLKNIDEAFLTGTTTQIARIKSIDEINFNTNLENSIITLLQKSYADLKNNF